MTVYQNCSNRSAPLNKMAARAKNRKTFKQLLFLNQCIDFEIMIQECSLDDCPLKLLKPFRYVEQDGRQSKNRKTFKQLLLLNQEMDFEIIIQECFLANPQPKLLKQFRYVEINGRQGYK